MRLLILDDDPGFVTVLKQGLILSEFKVDSAGTPQQALEMIARQRYAVAIVDLNLPEGGGRKFLEQYRHVDPLLAVIIVTASPPSTAAVEFLSGGANALALDYIHKPEPKLLKRVATAVDKYGRRLESGDFKLDIRLRQAYWRDQPLELREKEMACLHALLLNPDGIDYVELARAVYGRTMELDEAITKLAAPLSRLRRKLEDTTGHQLINSWAGNNLRLLAHVVG